MLDIENLIYRDSRPTNMKVKYEREFRFCLGVAMVKKLNGVVEGRRCDPYNYTGRTINTESKWQQKVK